MILVPLGRGLLVGGLIAALVSGAPALLLATVLPGLDDGFAGILALMLSLTVLPLALVFASAGAVLLLLGLWRRRG